MSVVIPRAKVEFKPKGVYFPRGVPQVELEWPTPRQRPIEPNKQPLALYLIPALFMFASILLPLFLRPANEQNSWVYLVSGMSAFSSFGMAAYYWWDYRKKRQEYHLQLQQRLEEFKQGLVQLENKLQQLAQKQRRILEDRYPSAELLLQIALDPKTRDKRLWARHKEDEDFLAIRVGVGEGEPSFSLQRPPNFPPEDQELQSLVNNTYKQWQRVGHLPIVLPLSQVGSVAILGERKALEQLLNRVILDLAIHHSPRIVRIGLIGSDGKKSARSWGWLRWLPHTHLLEEPDPPFVALTVQEGHRLIDIVAQRLREIQSETEPSSSTFQEVFVLILDDAGIVRRSHVVQQLLEAGPKIGVYLILVGEPVIRGVRAVIRVGPDGRLSYKAELPSSTGDGTRVRVNRRGKAELLSVSQAEEAARAMLQLEPPEPPTLASQIPNVVPLAELLSRTLQHLYQELMAPANGGPGTLFSKTAPAPDEVLSQEVIQALWQQLAPLFSTQSRKGPSAFFRYLLRFPVGVTIERGQLVPVELNLLPEGSLWDGKAAYHSILIGPTGSGKSVFLKTLIWAGAFLYPPVLFNVFFLDFKGGAAVEDFKYRDTSGNEVYLPHLVGVVTNPGQSDPTFSAYAISRRGIHAISLELKRRETLIVRQGGAENIWEYNQKVLAARRGENSDVDPNLPLLPHLLIIIDEFSNAVDNFPELGDILDDLVRRGRAFGMYLLLANQNVTTVITRLLPNVGWAIGLRLKEEALREVIPGNWPPLDRVGRGYLRCVPDGHVVLFQSAWGDAPLREEVKEQDLAIYEITPSGRSTKPIFRYKPTTSSGPSQNGKGQILSQGKYLTQLIGQIVRDFPEFHQFTRQVYLEPLPAELDLEEILQAYGKPWVFEEGQWKVVPGSVTEDLSTPIGLMDNWHEVRYDPVYVHLHQGVGHLWILGTATSGKELAVEALLLGLAHRYTPEQVWFYLVESGTALMNLAGLPHVGAHISLSHRESFARFIAFLRDEYKTRKLAPDKSVPRIVVVLHNFHRRVWGEVDDEALNLVEELLKNGAALGIHLILTSASVGALREEDASALVPRIILDMGKNENFWDAGLGRKDFFELTRRVPGRGYWLERLGYAGRELQIARHPKVTEVVEQMNASWKGPRPPSLQPLPACITWSAWKEAWQTHHPNKPWYEEGLPAGYDFDHRPLVAPLSRNDPLWWVFAPAGRGKTFLLLLWAQAALERPEPWEVWYLAAKTPPSLPVTQHERFHMYVDEEIGKGWEQLAQVLQQEVTQPQLLLLDDGDQVLGRCPSETAQVIVQALQKGRLYGLWALRSANLSRLAAPLFDHPFRELLTMVQDERRGFVLSGEADYLGIYGVSSQMRRKYPAQWAALEQPVRGRGLWIWRDTWKVIQVPTWMNSCEEE